MSLFINMMINENFCSSPPILDNNARVILPVQTVHRCQARSTSGLFIMASLPVSPAFLAGNHEVRERGDSERLQTLQTATSAWERKQREKKEDEEEERKPCPHFLSFSLSKHFLVHSYSRGGKPAHWLSVFHRGLIKCRRNGQQ